MAQNDQSNESQYGSFEASRERAKELWDQVAVLNGYSSRLPAVARTSRMQAERERQRISDEAVEATKQLCDQLVIEAENHMAKARRAAAEADLLHSSGQTKMDEAEQELGKAKEAAESMLEEAQAKAHSLTDEAQRDAQKKLKQAEKAWSDTRTSSDAEIAEAHAEAEEILKEARENSDAQIAEARAGLAETRGASEVKLETTSQRAHQIIEEADHTAWEDTEKMKAEAATYIQKALSDIETIHSALQEELEAQEIYTEAARIKANSEQRRLEVNQRAEHENETQDRPEMIIETSPVVEPSPVIVPVEDTPEESSEPSETPAASGRKRKASTSRSKRAEATKT